MNNSLDPSDWVSLEKLGNKMIKDMMSYFQNIEGGPTWNEAPGEVKAFFKKSVPSKGVGQKQAYQEFKTKILPYSFGNGHPRFWGYVTGTGFPYAMLSDMLASGMNSISGNFNQSANFLEVQTINWFKKIMNYPQGSSGIFASGGSMSNFIGLNVARNKKAMALGIDIRKQGVSAIPENLTYYCSKETHSSVDRAIDMLGIGTDYLRKIDTNKNYQIDVEKLETTIKNDLEKGFNPCCVIGNAGTTGTGAIDDLITLSSICKKYNLWLHVDGAFGSWASISKKYGHLVKGLDCSDSLAFDLHKWMYLPFETACVLIKDKEAHFKTYNIRPDYIATSDKGFTSGEWLSDYGPQLCRRFNALKVWMSIYAIGLDKFAAMIEKDINHAKYVEKLVTSSDELELLTPVSLNVVCFRYRKEKHGDKKLNEINKTIVSTIQDNGIAMPSSKILDGKYGIRIAITNHRSQRSDFDKFIKETIRIGNLLTAK